MSKKRLSLVLTLGAALALGLIWLPVNEPRAAEKEQPKTTLPDDLANVPANGMMMITFRPADLWTGKLGKALRDKIGKDIAVPLAALEGGMGLPPAEVERITLVLPAPRSFLMLVAATKKVDIKKVRTKILPNSSEETYKGRKYYAAPRGQALALIADKVFALGSKEDIEKILAGDKKNSDGGLSQAIKLAAKKHSVVLGVSPKSFKDVAKEEPDNFAPYKSLMEGTWATATLDVGETTKVEVKVQFGSEKDAKAALAPATKNILVGAKLVGQLEQMLIKDKAGKELLAMVKTIKGKLTKDLVKQNGAQLSAKGEVTVKLETMAALGVEAVRKVRVAALRAQSANNLKQIGVAMHNYADTHNAFPAQAVYDKNGKALLSWRVLILPYIEQDALYKEFRLDEPWDSKHNKKLLAKMPMVYAAPSGKTKHKYGTFYQGFAGKDAFFDGKRGTTFAGISDGTSNTIMVVEAGTDVPWTKPEDVPFVPGKMDPKKLGGVFTEGFNVGMCDGSVRFMTRQLSKTTLEAMITRNGGEVLGNDFE